MNSVNEKICPVCRQSAPPDAEWCPSCQYEYHARPHLEETPAEDEFAGFPSAAPLDESLTTVAASPPRRRGKGITAAVLAALLILGAAASRTVRSIATGFSAAYAGGPNASLQATLKQLHRGMSQKQVQAAIGPPDSVQRDTYSYSRYDGALQINFNQAGVVENFQSN